MGYMLTVVVAAGWVSFWDYFATEKKGVNLIKKVKLKQNKGCKKKALCTNSAKINHLLKINVTF